MAKNIKIRAGKRALSIIKEEGLKSERVKTIIGASGGPKFLVLNGLDRFIFGSWLRDRKEPLSYIGTSIGAWRSLALSQNQPVEALSCLVKEYISQTYNKKPTRYDTSKKTKEILDSFVSDDKIEQILNHPYFRVNIIANRCRGLGGFDKTPLLGAHMAVATAANFVKRGHLKHFFDRAIFFDPRQKRKIDPKDSFCNFYIPLTKKNIRKAVIASGSIPFVMEGVSSIDGAPKGTYRDGGLLDYHFDRDFSDNKDEIVLYPHFYDYIIPGWMDKYLPHRISNGQRFDNVVLVSPSPEFVDKLPNRKIPDRTDFKTYFNNDEERIKIWHQVVNASQRLGDEFSEILESGNINEHIEPITAH